MREQMAKGQEVGFIERIVRGPWAMIAILLLVLALLGRAAFQLLQPGI